MSFQQSFISYLSLTDRSPLFGHFSTTLLGLPTIRAFGVQENFTDFYNNHQDEHTKAWFAYIGSASWLSFRLEILSLLFISFVVFISIAIKDKLSLTAGQVGLMLAYTINITGVFQQCVRQSTEVENHMTSVERVLEYCELESEPPAETDVKPPDEWPKRGSIRFKDMSFSYAKGLPNVLNGINCHIKSNEKASNKAISWLPFNADERLSFQTVCLQGPLYSLNLSPFLRSL